MTKKIDYSRPWHELDIDISNAIRSDVDLDVLHKESPFYGRDLVVFFYDSTKIKEILSAEWLQYMEDIGIPVKSCIIFRREPNYLCEHAHIDQFFDKLPAIYAINWIMDSKDDSEMIWYNVPADLPGKDDMYGDTTNFRSWPMEQVVDYEFERKCIGFKPTLVNTGIAHNVITRGRTRWAISIRIKYHAGHVFDNWEQVVDFYQRFIKT